MIPLRFSSLASAIRLHNHSLTQIYNPIPARVKQYSLLGATIKFKPTLATKNAKPNRNPHSRTAIPTQKDAAAIKNKLLDSITELNNIIITEKATSNPAVAIFFAPTCMRTNLLPYIHTWCPSTTNHNRDCRFQNFGDHNRIPCSDTADL